MQSTYSAAGTVQMGFESNGGVVQTSFLPSMSHEEKVNARYNVNKYSSFLLPAPTRGVDGSIIVCSADESNKYFLSNYSLHYGQRDNQSAVDHGTLTNVRSEDWYSMGRYSNTTVGKAYHESSKLRMLPIASMVAGPSGSMVSKAFALSVPEAVA